MESSFHYFIAIYLLSIHITSYNYYPILQIIDDFFILSVIPGENSVLKIFMQESVTSLNNLYHQSPNQSLLKLSSSN